MKFASQMLVFILVVAIEVALGVLSLEPFAVLVIGIVNGYSIKLMSDVRMVKQSKGRERL